MLLGRPQRLRAAAVHRFCSGDQISSCAALWRQGSALAPHTREPGLLLDRQARRTVEVALLVEVGGRYQGAPTCPVVKHAATLTVPALLAIAAWVRAEQHAAKPQAGLQLSQPLAPAG